MNPNPFQFNAMQSGQPSLAQQLFAGNTGPATASANNVKNVNAPLAQTSTAALPSQTLPTPFGGSFAGGGGTSFATPNFPTASPSMGSFPALGSLGTTPVVKHTIAADGSQSVTHATPTDTGSQSSGSQGTSGGSTTTPPPPITPPTPTNPQTQAGTNQPANPNGNPYTGLLAGNSSYGSPVAGAAASGLLNTAQPQSNPLTSGPALDNYNAAVTNLENLKSGIAATEGGIESSPIPLEFQQGREQALNRQYAAQLDAAQTAVSQAQTALGYGIQEQGQQQTGLTSAGQLGNTAQGLLQSGLTSAGQLAQPTPTEPGQAVFNPATGQYTSGGSPNGNPASAPSGINQGAWSQYIQDMGTGNIGAIPSSITGNANLMGQLQQATGAQYPGFNYNTAVGQGTGQQALGAAAGTGAASGTAAAAAAPGQATATQIGVAQGYQSAYQQATNIQNQFSDLLNTFNLNPSDLNAANAAIQKIAANTSNPQYQELSNYIKDFAARSAQVLTPPGGSATDTTRSIATGMLDATAKGTSLQAVMKSLGQQMQAVIAGVPTNAGGSTGTSGGGWLSLGD